MSRLHIHSRLPPEHRDEARVVPPEQVADGSGVRHESRRRGSIERRNLAKGVLRVVGDLLNIDASAQSSRHPTLSIESSPMERTRRCACRDRSSQRSRLRTRSSITSRDKPSVATVTYCLA